MERPSGRSNLTILAWVLALAALGVYAWTSSFGRTTHGFIAYYAAARLLITGQLGAHVFDDAWFMTYVRTLTRTDVLDIYGPNTPMMAWLAVPVALFTPLTARAVWIVVSIAAFAAAVSWLARETRSTLHPVLLFLLIVNPPVLANLRTGQAYLFVAAVYAVIAVLLLRQRDGAAGVALGLILALKAAGAPLLVFLAFQRRWRACAAAVGAAALAAVVTAFWVDGDLWSEYLAYVPAFLNRPTIAVTANQSLVGWARRFGDLGPTAPLAILAAAVLFSAWRTSASAPGTWIAAGVVMALLFAPVAEDHHFAAAVVPVLLMERRPRAAWLIVAALLMVPLRWTAFRFTADWPALLAYPRLYGTVLLAGLASASNTAERAEQRT